MKFLFLIQYWELPWQSTGYDSNAVGMGLISDWETKIPCAQWLGQKKKFSLYKLYSSNYKSL